MQNSIEQRFFFADNGVCMDIIMKFSSSRSYLSIQVMKAIKSLDKIVSTKFTRAHFLLKFWVAFKSYDHSKSNYKLRKLTLCRIM
jgi:hypothetical protein